MNLSELSARYDVPLKVLRKLRVVQNNLLKYVKFYNVGFDFSNVKYVSGFDISFISNNVGVVAGITLDNDFNIVEKTVLKIRVSFPYVPSFLAFREAPHILRVLKKMSIKPDLIFVDGHGMAHPVFLGLASFVGVVTKIPTIGVAKNILVGVYEAPMNVGEYKPIFYKNRIVGFVLKTGKKYRPIFISPGNLVSTVDALNLTIRWIKDKNKLPEPLRLAHIVSKEYAHILNH